VLSGLVDIVQMDKLCQEMPMRLCAEDKTLYFTVGRHWEFSSRLYERAAIDFPMKMRWTVSGFGRSSFDHFQTYHEEDQTVTVQDQSSLLAAESPSSGFNKPLAWCVYRLVFVDPMTQKSTPLPEELVNRLSSVVVPGGERYQTFRPPSTIPHRIFSHRIRVRYDDEFLGHMNVGSFLRFVLECAARAAESGFYSRIHNDIAFWRVRQATSVYLMESHAGDKLDVHTWEDDENQLLLNFTVNKHGQMAYYAQVEYFDNAAFEN
jgi:acyl-CoA thioesterase FadM